jgi:hypothetical protein
MWQHARCNIKDHDIITVTTAASKIAVAAILFQVQDGMERLIACASRQINKAEQTYSVSKVKMGNEVLSLLSVWKAILG